ncbi:MAG: CYTH domain-containing protein [Novosphingobium sp.]|nr:CYTH domain-containing protein [Novosphingobium sp.]
MAREIERKFLVCGDGWKARAVRSRHVRQAYLALAGKVNVRVRVIDDAEAVLTIKSAEAGQSREEFEYPIPLEDAEALIALRVGNCIEKRRFIVPAGAGANWEIDVFDGPHRGLVLAEIELAEGGDIPERPGWLGEEVTHEERYYNAALARH